ncbi:hypothetical protein AURDEDRAFT_154250 [Auricularia subglabra TFB-10046 SS5]|nr:hypothetical protein AURDEDRAFT_154250 [Auricularia subglabra TFB-10046 SS5]
MGETGSFCFICGGNALVGSRLAADIGHAVGNTYARAGPPSSPFHCSLDDVKWQENLVLLGPLNANGDELVNPLIYTPNHASVVDVKTVRLLAHIVPGDSHSFLTVTHRDTLRDYIINDDLFPFCHAGCFHIFETVVSQSPRALSYPARVLWAVIRKQNLGARTASVIRGVDYGVEIERTRERRAVAPLANIQRTYLGSGLDDLPPRVLRCLSRRIYDPATVEDWWLGRGAMWIFTRPDIFPLLQAYGTPLPAPVAGTSYFDRLPVELVDEIGKHLDFADFVSFILARALGPERVRAHVPDWMQPPPADVAQVEDEQRMPLPWIQYARCCLASSASMRNRQRIFGIAHQILRIAEDMTDAELGQ